MTDKPESKRVWIAVVNHKFPKSGPTNPEKKGPIPELLAMEVGEVYEANIQAPEFHTIVARVTATFQRASGETYTLKGKLHSIGYENFAVLFTSPYGSGQRTVEENIGEFMFFGVDGIDLRTWNQLPE